MSGGLLINGRIIPVPGVDVLPPASHGGPAWCALDPGDYRPRRTPWVRAIVVHTTKGAKTQHVKPGRGPGGKDRAVADFWHRDPTHSAAQLVADTDGSIACLADLGRACAYHATVSNDWSIGIELYQEEDGGVWEATLGAAVVTIEAICTELAIPFQFVDDPYNGHPCPRLVSGGPDVVGIYGHRCNTEQRGWGDPGDEIFARLRARGAVPVRLAAGEDLELGKQRQQVLVARGLLAAAGVDGVLGPASIAAMRRGGYARWGDVP